jgi:GNAT superfamily N-acetyltransferase
MDQKYRTDAIRLATVEDARAIARVHVDSWRTTYSGLLSEAYLRSLSYEDRSARWARILRCSQRDEFVYVALGADGQIVGFASGGPERSRRTIYKGELYALYLLKHAQRSGLGRQLVLTVADHLIKQSTSTMLVWVLATNPACAFYRRMGGKYVRSKMEFIGEEMLREQAFGWKNLPALFDF